jgi:competence protein ComEA
MSFKTTVAAALAMLLPPALARPDPAAPPVRAPRRRHRSRRRAQPARPPPRPTLVNVNTANADELDKLPQIGPARAKAILDNRVAAKGGAYKDLADLEKRADLPKNAGGDSPAIKDKIRLCSAEGVP